MGTIKINLDGSWKKDSPLAGVGVVARDSDGLLISGSALQVNASSPIEAEAKTVLEAISLAKRNRYMNVSFESDSQTLINSINSSDQPSVWVITPLVARIRRVWFFL